VAKLPDGIGEGDGLSFGLSYPSVGRIVFRDRDGKETTLERRELLSFMEDAARILAQDEVLKFPRAKPGQLPQEVVERIHEAVRNDLLAKAS
jgi:hypothetical protein